MRVLIWSIILVVTFAILLAFPTMLVINYVFSHTMLVTTFGGQISLLKAFCVNIILIAMKSSIDVKINP